MITVAAGILVTIVDHESYPSIGSGLWWAVADGHDGRLRRHVPENVAGRLVAVLVMSLGISFLTVITAAITSTFVARSRLDGGVRGGRGCHGGAGP